MPAPADALSLALARLATGDRRAFDEVFSLAWPTVHRFCKRALGDGDEADDASQVALETVFREASDYDARRPALPWVLAIASWECASARRRAARRPHVTLDTASAVTGPETPEQLLSEARLLATLDDTLAQLPPSDREALRAAFSDELHQRGPLDPAARKRKQRALGRLQALWRSLHGD